MLTITAIAAEHDDLEKIALKKIKSRTGNRFATRRKKTSAPTETMLFERGNLGNVDLPQGLKTKAKIKEMRQMKAKSKRRPGSLSRKGMKQRVPAPTAELPALGALSASGGRPASSAKPVVSAPKPAAPAPKPKARPSGATAKRVVESASEPGRAERVLNYAKGNKGKVGLGVAGALAAGYGAKKLYDRHKASKEEQTKAAALIMLDRGLIDDLDYDNMVEAGYFAY